VRDLAAAANPAPWWRPAAAGLPADAARTTSFPSCDGGGLSCGRSADRAGGRRTTSGTCRRRCLRERDAARAARAAADAEEGEPSDSQRSNY
jgi:hypothetical protein